MKTGLITWRELPSIGGNVLVIINSAVGDEGEVAALVERLAERAPSGAMHAIAAQVWQPWLTARNWAASRVLFTTDVNGQELELNYFLETPEALQWILERRFAAVAGSLPHSQYNDEVKEVFERRVGLFLGRARFLAHALPTPFVYV